ncbi:hypothetical protein BDQ12DRAFT_716277 [Crucibulum laeve]|uniref:Ricin B lectin domain-containing protein n=1 Tax=Crucibulum laeve TaxID=68775 RepID=A0A5C3LJ35_9AGAR|nr:hypothetical protein BDQ12DRAFT_716277 [Crucibulum laeve]
MVLVPFSPMYTSILLLILSSISLTFASRLPTNSASITQNKDREIRAFVDCLDDGREQLSSQWARDKLEFCANQDIEDQDEECQQLRRDMYEVVVKDCIREELDWGIGDDGESRLLWKCTAPTGASTRRYRPNTANGGINYVLQRIRAVNLEECWMPEEGDVWKVDAGAVLFGMHQTLGLDAALSVTWKGGGGPKKRLNRRVRELARKNEREDE